MRLTFIGKDPNSNPSGSPTVYRTDRDSWVVQGWVVTDPGALAQMSIPEGETVVEIPDRMFLIYAGSGLTMDRVTSEEPADIRLCRSAFEAVWRFSIPHREYAPV